MTAPRAARSPRRRASPGPRRCPPGGVQGSRLRPRAGRLRSWGTAGQAVDGIWRSPGGAFGAPEQLSTDTVTIGPASWTPNASGGAAIGWVQGSGTSLSFELATRSAGQDFHGPFAQTNPEDVIQPIAVAISDDGATDTGYFVDTNPGAGPSTVLQLDANGSPVETTNFQPLYMSLAVNARGGALLVWRGFNFSGVAQRAPTRRSPRLFSKVPVSGLVRPKPSRSDTTIPFITGLSVELADGSPRPSLDASW